MHKVITRIVADAVLIAIIMFSGAGMTSWRGAWVLLAVMLLVRCTGAVTVYRINPDLLDDRARLPIHAGQPWLDRVLLAGVLSTGILGLPLVAGLDVFHWHVFTPPPLLLRSFGLALFALGWSLKSVALRANAFAVPVVRIQHERAHALVDSGVYGTIRHPFYAADPMILIGMTLWLGSLLAAELSVVPIAFMVVRLQMEERFLRRELPGYDAYMLRVPHRLIPGVW